MGETSENSRCLQALLRCKKSLFIATYNAKTLRDEDRVLELEQCTQHQGIEILGVQEHRIIHDDPIEFRKVGSSYLVTSSGWRNEAQVSQGRVGLLLSQKARKALLKAKRISKRIMTAEFDGNPKTTVIVVYAPTNCADEVEVEEFYNDLRDGDFNARLGPDEVPFTYHGVTNRNGKYLVELLSEYSLIAANTQFKKRPGKLWTFMGSTGSLRQLDYILVRRKWRNSVQNAEAYNTFSTVGSDHRVVCAKIKLSLRISKAAKKIKYDWKQFSTDPDLQWKYTVAVKNRYHVLSDEGNGVKYEKFVKANRQAMEECLPKKTKARKSLRSSNAQVVSARQKAQAAQSLYECTNTEEDKEAWSQALSNLYKVYNQVREVELEAQIRTIEASHEAQKYGEAWKVVNEISGRKRAKEGQVEGSSPEERVIHPLF